MLIAIRAPAPRFLLGTEMECTQVKSDPIVFRGDAYQSIATAFLDGDKALLVDTLATRADAHAMDQYLKERFKVQVNAAVMTHHMSDHMGGLQWD